MKQKLRNGKLIEQKNGQDRLLEVLYGTCIGRMLLKPLTLPAISRAAGAFLSTSLSCVLIRPFVKKK